MTKPADIHICSLVVHCLSERLQSVCDEINAMQGASIPYSDEKAKLIVVLEATGEPEMIERMTAIASIYGVVASNMVYQQHESEETIDEEIFSCN